MSAIFELRAGQVQTSIKAGFHRARRTQHFRALFLVAPLGIFIVLGFVLPIVMVLGRSVYDAGVAKALPLTSAALAEWRGEGMPPASALDAIMTDLRNAPDNGGIGLAADRLNQEIPGFKSLLIQSEHRIGSGGVDLHELDPRWTDPRYWRAIKHALNPWTADYLLASLDLQWNGGGQIERVPQDQAIYVGAFLRTFWIGFLVTAISLLLGYPLALLLVSVPARMSNTLMMLVLIPFWTSLLVRTTAWVVLLQDHGVVNELIQTLGITSHPLPLIFNRVGVIIAMVHVLLPFMVLPLYSVMKGIPSSYVRAAKSLGASPATAFRRVYVPQTLPGLGAGCLLVFIQALGYYITPALIGGSSDQMISYFIALHANQTLIWGMASALAAILLILILILYSVYSRLVGIDKLSIG